MTFLVALAGRMMCVCIWAPTLLLLFFTGRQYADGFAQGSVSTYVYQRIHGISMTPRTATPAVEMLNLDCMSLFAPYTSALMIACHVCRES